MFNLIDVSILSFDDDRREDINIRHTTLKRTDFPRLVSIKILPKGDFDDTIGFLLKTRTKEELIYMKRDKLHSIEVKGND